jgi:NADH:ubiquinone oxidoreductase subunit 6 (subunit J)
MLTGVIGLGFAAVVLPVAKSYFPDVSHAEPRVEGTVAAVGKLLYTDYLFLFEAASVLILAALVGAVMLARRDKLQPVIE